MNVSDSFLWSALIIAPPLLVAVILHELAHGYVAEKLGDPTARLMGRISFNPIKHIDPIMTILLPGLLIVAGSPVVFGGAKPVPVNPNYFRHPRRGMAYVALAGPVVNFLLAFVSIVALKIIFTEQAPASIFAILLASWLLNSVLINLVLGLFNLFPIPPLDGGRIAVGFLPLPLAKIWARLEPWGLFIVFGLLYFGVLQKYIEPALKVILNWLR